MEEGIIDSTGILELIEFLESHFGIEVSEAETVPQNLGSIASLTEFVMSKRSVREPASRFRSPELAGAISCQGIPGQHGEGVTDGREVLPEHQRLPAGGCRAGRRGAGGGR